MINTQNESSLHRTLKIMYSQEKGSRTEVAADGHIYDILTADGTVIEIQTKNISSLKKKLADAIKKGKRVIIVHPVARQKIIETYSANGTLLSKRKSPIKENEYSTLRELTGIYELLLNSSLTLELIFADITEIRTQTQSPVQSANKRRRIKKNWIKTDKKLKQIHESRIFCTKEDYLSLLPAGLFKDFTVKDIQRALKDWNEAPKNAYRYANLLAWLLLHMNLITQTGKIGQAKLYSLKQD